MIGGVVSIDMLFDRIRILERSVFREAGVCNTTAIVYQFSLPSAGVTNRAPSKLTLEGQPRRRSGTEH